MQSLSRRAGRYRIAFLGGPRLGKLLIVAQLCCAVTTVQAQSAILNTAVDISQDAAERLRELTSAVARGPLAPLLATERGSAKGLLALSEATGLPTGLSSDRRIFPLLQKTMSDSLQLCADTESPPGWCRNLSATRVVSLHGTVVVAPTHVIVRIKLYQKKSVNDRVNWMIAEVHYSKSKSGMWEFSKIGQLYAG